MTKELSPEEQQLVKALEEQAKVRQKYLPCYKLLKKRQLRFKYARVGDSQVEYCRVEELDKVVNTHHQQFKSLLGCELPLEQLKKQMIYFSRPLNAPQLRYPPILEFSNKPTQFISFPFNTEESRKGLMIGILLAILCLVLFPVWPYELKYAIWLLSLYFLIFLVGVLTVRLLVYSICTLFGVSVWLFPNLLQDNGFISSFKPFISYERWQRSKLTLVLRLLILGVFVYYSYVLYSDPSFIKQNIDNTKSAINDIHDWGVGKIKRQTNFSQRAIASVEEIINKTADKEPAAAEEQTL